MVCCNSCAHLRSILGENLHCLARKDAGFYSGYVDVTANTCENHRVIACTAFRYVSDSFKAEHGLHVVSLLEVATGVINNLITLSKFWNWQFFIQDSRGLPLMGVRQQNMCVDIASDRISSLRISSLRTLLCLHPSYSNMETLLPKTQTCWLTTTQHRAQRIPLCVVHIFNLHLFLHLDWQYREDISTS